MHVQTHILSGWCVGCMVPRFGKRERLFCTLAATLSDIDGLSILAGQNAYWEYHHTLGHNLWFGVLLCVVFAAFSKPRVLGLLVYLALFHLHLVLDYFGSGPGWGIPYLWPFSPRLWISPNAWPFYSWQNISTAFALFALTLWIARRQGRTPLELPMPRLDRQLVELLRGKNERRDAKDAEEKRQEATEGQIVR
jgi:LexA-binding, inner membrane-associated putative hydrolase